MVKNGLLFFVLGLLPRVGFVGRRGGVGSPKVASGGERYVELYSNASLLPLLKDRHFSSLIKRDSKTVAFLKP